ncbi:MAG: OmpA family protein [Desulfuromonadales bacterium]|nr:OmpA family protein [Desulfuromonadales bacterium]
MRRFVFLALTGIFICMLNAGGALAQIRGGAVTLSPMAGSLYFDPGQNLERSPVYSLGIGYNLTDRWAGEFVGAFSDTSPENGDAHINVYSGRLDLLYHFTPAEPATFYFAMGGGLLRYDPRGALSSLDEDDDLLLNYGLGLKAMVNDTAGFRLDARHAVTAENEEFSGKELNHFSYSAGLYFQFGGGDQMTEVSDSDGDGVSDGLDQCPGTPYGAEVDSLGCEIKDEEPGDGDSDGDGVTNNLDKCPGTPAGTMVNVHGCPNDADNDGVPNFRDRCADTPAGTVVDLHGCPKKPDADNDGVEDALDKCPNTPSYVPVNDSGCPRDGDGDYVFDFEDKCPDTPEGDTVNAEGCTVELEEPESVSLDIRFQRGSAALEPNQAREMDKARELLAKYPNATIVVEGHTDSTGSESFNLELSRKRAESVRQHLIDNLNVDADRVKARGYGESRPIAPNSTPEGRLKNRRVQVTVEP